MNDFALQDRGPGETGHLDVMNFLNEVSGQYPAALSFASGRPAEQFFRVEQWLDSIQVFFGQYANRNKLDPSTALNLLAQYGRTNGIINDLIAEQVSIDEHIACDGDQVIVTAGCQEAIALTINALCKDERDVILVRSPTYIGITGAAALQRVLLAPIICDNPDDLATALELEVRKLRAAGKRPRAFYVVPDFDNPTGSVLNLQTRQQLVSYCTEQRIAILEDNPYGMFRYVDDKLPSLAELDRHGCTIYLGTYSKTLCPTLRVGFIVVPKQLFGSTREAQQLIQRLSVIKSFITCNTSQFMQAVVGGVLLSESCSLAKIVEPAIAHYRNNLQVMLQRLNSTLGMFGDAITWNRPSGGFFMTVSLPFKFRQDEVVQCASHHRAIVMPLSFFALTDHHDSHVRLAFSNLSPHQIEIGIDRFSDFIKSRL